MEQALAQLTVFGVIYLALGLLAGRFRGRMNILAGVAVALPLALLVYMAAMILSYDGATFGAAGAAMVIMFIFVPALLGMLLLMAVGFGLGSLMRRRATSGRANA